MAKIINEQGRGQVGKTWGSGENPDCSGFTTAEFEQLDFSRIDMSEFIQEVASSVRMPDVTVKKKALDADAGEESADGVRTIFILKRNWFSLDQTEGDGTESRGIPESLARTSVQWKVYTEVASMSEVVELKANLAIEKARRQAEEDARQVTFNKECDRLRQAYPQLITRETESSDFKRCLVNVRIILKDQ